MTEQVNSYHDFKDLLPADVQAKLSEKLDPSLIKQRPGGGGKMLSYLEAYSAIAQANSIFGTGNWGPQVLKGPELHEIRIMDHSTGTILEVHEYYSAQVGIYLYGRLVSSDEGFGEVQTIAEGTDTKAMLGMHEKARKGAISDGIKRALRIFGSQFGNDLYAGGDGDATAVAADPNAPACPVHGAGGHVRESNRGSGYYCTRKAQDGSFCSASPAVPAAQAPPTEFVPTADGPMAVDGSANRPPPYDGTETADDWPYASPDPDGGAPSWDELFSSYLSMGKKAGVSEAAIRKSFVIKAGKPIEEATVEELATLVQRAGAVLKERE